MSRAFLTQPASFTPSLKVAVFKMTMSSFEEVKNNKKNNN